MTTSSATVPLNQLFADVNRLVKEDEEYEKAIKVINKILQADPGNIKALHCKAVCLIRISSFDDALATISLMDSASQKDVLFEKSYCMYRLNRVEEAVDLLQSMKTGDQRCKELLAQSLYRLERYEESYSYYVDLIKNSTDDCEDERETNLSAVMACISLSTGVIESSTTKRPAITEQTYELCYNKACILIGCGQYDEAVTMLKKSEEICLKLMREEEQSEEEIQQELAILHAQTGYVKQLIGKDADALQKYNAVLKCKPDDPALIAVVCNNIVTINKDQNVFDSKKKMKSALNEDAKLNSLQKKTILMNNCLFLIMSNQMDAARKMVKDLQQKYNDKGEAELIHAGLLVREGNIDDAVAVLKSVKDKNLIISLTLCQLLLKQGLVKDAINILTSLKSDQKYKPGIISALVSIHVSSNDPDAAIAVLTDALSFHKKHHASDDTLTILFRETSKLLMQQNRPQDAAKLLEEQRILTPNNPKIIAQLIAAYSQFDQKKADETMQCLPPIDAIIGSVDVNALEESNWSLGAKYVKKATKTAAAETAKPEDGKKKKKRKRKRYLGKNYDPNVDPDPERWLPKWQRSNYRKKKDKRKEADKIGKGSQGVVGDAPEVRGKTGTSSANQSAPQSPPGPRQQQQWQKKKKGKR